MLSGSHVLRPPRSTKAAFVVVAISTLIARTLTVEGRNGQGRNQSILANVQQLGCDFVGLQEAG